jgi:1-acylglycerone phosphate reductase
MPSLRSVLITGCSQGGLGDALARKLHEYGLRVIATGRNPTKIAHFESLGIETLILDVLSQDSISECAGAVAEKTGGSLDILINNSGAIYSIPLTDADIDMGRKLFDLNVWAVLAVIQAFIPLLLKSSRGILVNNTSVASVAPKPMSGIYNASKAATAMLTDTLRLELAPFGLKVIDLKTGSVKSRVYENQANGERPSLSDGSIYAVAKKSVEAAMAIDFLGPTMMEADVWANKVAGELLKPSPSPQIWKGTNTSLVWFSKKFLWHTFLDRSLMKLGALDRVRKALVAKL